MTTPPAARFKLAVFDVAGTTMLDGDAVVACLCASDRRADVGVPSGGVGGDGAAEAAGDPTAPLLAWHSHVMTLSRRPLLRRTASSAMAMIERYRHGSIEPADGAEGVFAALRNAGVRVVLDTGFSRDILDTVLERLGWAEGSTVDFSIASDEVERGRPHPDLIYRAMALAGVAESGMVVKIGDTPADVDAGTRRGLWPRRRRDLRHAYPRTTGQTGRAHHRSPSRPPAPHRGRSDVSGERDAVIGSGIVGLALAHALARRGRKVTVFETSTTPQGASVRNFGTLWPIGQPAGPRRTMALESLAIWREVLAGADAWSASEGSLHLAYHDDELAVLTEFAASATCRWLHVRAARSGGHPGAKRPRPPARTPGIVVEPPRAAGQSAPGDSARSRLDAGTVARAIRARHARHLVQWRSRSCRTTDLGGRSGLAGGRSRPSDPLPRRVRRARSPATASCR